MIRYSKGDWDDIRAAMLRVDEPDVLEEAKTNQSMRYALEMCRPVNWHGTGCGESLLRISIQEGIPLAWIPSEEIVMELANANDARSREEILEKNENQILNVCDESLDQCTHSAVSDSVHLAKKVLKAFRDGNHEAAMALAVSIGEPLAIWASTPRAKFFESKEERVKWTAERKRLSKYLWANEIELAEISKFISPYDFNYFALIAPIAKFFEPFDLEKGDTAPETLSRHLVAHKPTSAHFSRVNALKSVMLVCSIIREQHEWAKENSEG